MIRSMSIRIVSARTVKGKAWAEKYPARADDLWVVAQVGDKKKRVRVGPPTPENQAKAERKVDEYEAILSRQQLRDRGLVTLGFTEAADDWIKTGLRKRAPKTVEGRTYQAGAFKAHFGDTNMERIDAAAVVAWWDAEVEGKRDIRTGRAYLDALSLIFKHAAKAEPEIANPVPAARERIFGEIEQTAEFRARNERNCNPLSSDEMAKLLPALVRFGNPQLRLTVLLMYEGGLRLGEATGLRWGDVWLGRNAEDVSRSVTVRASRTNGRSGHTKSGRTRKVAISRRLRSVLLEWRVACGDPGPDRYLVDQNWAANIRTRLDRVCKLAKIERHTPKDFRDTYASTLITHGIVLKWISLQLGHGSVAVTERHYAAYMATEGYQNPWIVPAGCLPPDIFAELDGWVPATGTKRTPTDTKVSQVKAV